MIRHRQGGRRGVRVAGSVLVSVAVATVCWISAGDLNPPPGPVLPTNRVQLNEQVITLPHTISQSGSYVLTSNLIGSSGQDGIVIDASDVTLDLNGFSLIGVVGSLDGVRINGAHRNITIKNGIVDAWDGHGINASSVVSGRFEALTIGSSGLDGLRLGSDSIVRDLSISGCSSAGIHVGGMHNRIEATHVTNNGTGVAVVGTDNLIVKNNASGNSTDYDIGADNAFGPIAGVGGVGDISVVAAANHPWANFSHSCAPSDELCDGVDNDCDGAIDEGNPGGGAACDGPDSDLCNEGVIECTNGSLICSDATGDNVEVCDGQDNDCDGAVDNGTVCGPNQFCDIGSCSCDAGFEDCNADPGDGCEAAMDSDPNHCGACANACPNGFECVSGACTCPAGTTNCGGECVDRSTDPDHCGACLAACLSGYVCQRSFCVCPSGTINCGATCADLANDPNNCGSCNNQCVPGASCLSGACRCPSGQTICNGVCVDLQSDPNHCGSCGDVCPSGASCDNGACSCPSGTVNCGNTCADLANDVNNCGSCNNQCPSGTNCVSGACQ